jgi:hypothetical protein
MVRSVLSVVAGYLVNLLGVTSFFAIVVAALGGLPADPAAFQPPAWLTVAELAVTPVLAVAGGYVCAWLARRKEMAHALALVGVMAVLGVVSAIAYAGVKPLWSMVALVVLGGVGVLGGARLRLAHARA